MLDEVKDLLRRIAVDVGPHPEALRITAARHRLAVLLKDAHDEMLRELRYPSAPIPGSAVAAAVSGVAPGLVGALQVSEAPAPANVPADAKPTPVAPPAAPAAAIQTEEPAA